MAIGNKQFVQNIAEEAKYFIVVSNRCNGEIQMGLKLFLGISEGKRKR